MARLQEPAEPVPPPPVRPPRELLEPCVEDFVTPDEEPVGGPLSSMYRGPDEDDLAWRYRQVADRRYQAALVAFRREHRGQRLDITAPEAKRWLLGEGPLWRDRASFMARARS